MVMGMLRKGGIVLLCAAAAVVVYGAYVLLSYQRIQDELTLPVVKGAVEGIAPNRAYVAVTYNIGYGSYPPDYSFFMDGGTESRARSVDSVFDCIEGSIEELDKLEPDLILLQEVDIDATRSLHINEYRHLCIAYYDYDSICAVNYDSAYLPYPIREPIGKTKSGVATFSRFGISSGLRRSLPVSGGLDKLVDLDRCYTVAQLPVTNGKTLYLYNAHLSAYADGDIGQKQLAMLLADMQEKMDQGHYVICGGDFNRDFTGDSMQRLNRIPQKEQSWTKPFATELLPKGVSQCVNYIGEDLVPSCRNLDEPYEEGHTLVLIVDGFLVSSNVLCKYVQNVDLGFRYSDHNPVALHFILEDG